MYDRKYHIIFFRIGGNVMKKAVSKLSKKNFWGAMNCLALLFTVLTSQLLCAWYFHQPEFPAEADKYRKFK
jgi:cyclic lactone autoinducer peptide